MRAFTLMFPGQWDHAEVCFFSVTRHWLGPRALSLGMLLQGCVLETSLWNILSPGQCRLGNPEGF